MGRHLQPRRAPRRQPDAQHDGVRAPAAAAPGGHRSRGFGRRHGRAVAANLGEAIEIRTVYATGLWRCEADPSQLQSALLNLALNARDAMPTGGRLTFDARNVRLDADYAARNADVTQGNYVLIAVSDTGAGMPREVADRAFVGVGPHARYGVRRETRRGAGNDGGSH